MTVRRVRRSTALLAAVTTLCLAAAPAAVAAPSAPPPHPEGLYGTADPTYDGVFRQSYALLAQHTVGVTPAASAVGWLAGQQCADGGFTAFRADTAKACPAKGKMTGPDSNSTAAAAQALAALGGHKDAVRRAADWLTAAQNADGGWGYTPGLPSDANSTGLAIGALTAAGHDPGGVRSVVQRGKEGGRSAYEGLLPLALPCGKGGAFGLRDAKTGKLAANADATAAAVLGGLGRGPAVTPATGTKDAAAASACEDTGTLTPQRAARNGAAYLRTLLARTPYLKSSLPGAADQPDYGNTADAIVALAAAGNAATARGSIAWLEKHATPWATQNGPAAWAELILAAHATGTDPRHFGGTDLVKSLDATGPAPQSTVPPKAAAAAKSDEKDGGSTAAVWWAVGVCLVVGIGFGLLISARSGRKA